MIFENWRQKSFKFCYITILPRHIVTNKQRNCLFWLSCNLQGLHIKCCMVLGCYHTTVLLPIGRLLLPLPVRHIVGTTTAYLQLRITRHWQQVAFQSLIKVLPPTLPVGNAINVHLPLSSSKTKLVWKMLSLLFARASKYMFGSFGSIC